MPEQESGEVCTKYVWHSLRSAKEYSSWQKDYKLQTDAKLGFCQMQQRRYSSDESKIQAIPKMKL